MNKSVLLVLAALFMGNTAVLAAGPGTMPLWPDRVADRMNASGWLKAAK